MASSTAAPAGGIAGQPDVVAFTRPRSPAAEAYRTLRTNLLFTAVERPLRRLLLTSAGPDEGKSTTLANLAVTLAQNGARVIVVDADLRRPSQHTIFNLRNTSGLTNLFLAPAGTRSAADLPLQETAVPNLWLLASGPLPPNPAELLASPRMEEILTQLGERADVLLLDCPPVLAVTDAAILTARAGGVLLVLGAGKVKRDVARKAKAQLEAVGAHVMGMAVNNVPFDASSFGDYYGEPEPAA